MSDSSKAWLIGVLIASVTVLFGGMGYTSFLNEKKALSELRSEVASLNKRLDTVNERVSEQEVEIAEGSKLLLQVAKNLESQQSQEHTDFKALMSLHGKQQEHLNELTELANLLSKRSLSQVK